MLLTPIESNKIKTGDNNTYYSENREYHACESKLHSLNVAIVIFN